jgi:hypothetical protein
LKFSQVKDLAEKGDDAGLSWYLANMINHRFLEGTDVTPEIITAAKTTLNKPGEALNPFKYRAGTLLRASQPGTHVKAPSMTAHLLYYTPKPLDIKSVYLLDS